MILFPAIDLKDGSCVRLYQGDMEQATVFNDNPAAQAKRFWEEGAQWLHVVDLNGAFAGKAVNAKAVREIRDAIKIPMQLGGGIRTLEDIERWVRLGIDRVILGTIALKSPHLVKEACRMYPKKIVVGIDARDGMVAVEGWATVSHLSVIDLAKKYEDAGVAAIIYTDVSKDGAMQGPDLDGTRALAQAVSTPIIASGGVSSLDDLRAIKALAADGVIGVISGRAIYDGAFTIRQGQEVLK